MSIYKRGTVWWIKFTAPDGSRVQRSAETTDQRQAQELHDRLKAEAWRVKQLGERPRHSWQEAVVRWLKESTYKRTLHDDQLHLRWLHPHFSSLMLDEITHDRVDKIKQLRLSDGVTPTTVNRMLEVVRAILNRAVKEWQWLGQAPHIRMLKVENERVRWLTKEEAERLLHELPPHLAEMARLSLLTGLREANVTGLQWDQVDLERRCAWIHAKDAKARRAIAVPLNDEALQCIRRQIGKNLKYVFTYEGKRVTRCNNHAWKKALKRAGIDNFRWHDLRHTWASWHVVAGTPLHVLKEMGSWSSMDLVMRYAHLSPGHLAGHAGNVSLALGTNRLQLVR